MLLPALSKKFKSECFAALNASVTEGKRACPFVVYIFSPKEISERNQSGLSHRNGFVVCRTWHKSPLLKWFLDNPIIPKGSTHLISVERFSKLIFYNFPLLF